MTQRRLVAQLCATATILLFVMLAAWLVLVLPAWGHTVDNEAYFGRVIVDRDVVRVDSLTLSRFTPLTMSLAMLLLLVIAWFRGIFWVGFFTCGGVGAAWVGAEILKHIVPWHALVASDASLPSNLQAETFPSGHTTAITALGLAAVIISPAKWRSWVAVAAGVVAASVATAVLFAGWHRPSDAIGGLCWSGAVMAVTTGFIALIRYSERSTEVTRRQRETLAPLIASCVVGLFAFIAFWAVANLGNPDFPDADAAYLWFVGSMVVLAFAITAWFGFVLTRVTWVAEGTRFRRGPAQSIAQPPTAGSQSAR